MAPIKLAIIIPTLNAAQTLPKQIGALKNQDHNIDQIIIVDSSSEDNTASIARDLNVKLLIIEKGCFDHGATRNLAASETNADIILFMTQDAMPVDNKTIERLIVPLRDESIVVSYARQIAADWASPSERFLRHANYPPVSQIKGKQDIPKMGIRTFLNSNVCSAYRRNEFFELGGFPEPIVCNEDMIIAFRAISAGYNVAYCADAVVWHTHHYNSLSLFKRYFDIAASLEKEPRIKELGRLEASGLRYLWDQLLYMLNGKYLYSIPLVLLETGAKYLGYKCGLKYHIFPPKWRVKLGLNESYWEKAVRIS